MDWPETKTPETGQPIIIAAADACALRTLLGNIKGIKVVQWPSAQCHALYFNSGNLREIKAVLDNIQGQSILTIGQNQKFLGFGGMVNLHEQNGRLKLQIAPQTAAAANIHFSARLLSIALVQKAAK